MGVVLSNSGAHCRVEGVQYPPPQSGIARALIPREEYSCLWPDPRHLVGGALG